MFHVLSCFCLSFNLYFILCLLNNPVNLSTNSIIRAVVSNQSENPRRSEILDLLKGLEWMGLSEKFSFFYFFASTIP